MALDKQSIPLNFSQGVDTKSDPFQVQLGKFLSLTNSVFDEIGMLKKRNGFPQLTTLADESTYLTTFKSNLTAIGSTISAYSSSTATWVQKGTIVPASLDVVSMIKNSTNQIQCDAVTAPNGLTCVVYSDSDGSTTTYKYAVLDSITGQNIVSPVAIPISSGTVSGAPRVFLLERFFVIVFTNIVTAVNHLDYIAVSISNPTVVTTNASISVAYTPNSRLSFDGIVAGGNLYLAWNGNDGGGAIRVSYLTNYLSQGNTVVFAGRTATIMSMCADTTGNRPNIYAVFYESVGPTGYLLCVDSSLNTVLAPTLWLSGGSATLNVTSSAQNAVVTIIYEVDQTYSYDSGIKTNATVKKTCTVAGSVSGATVVSRSVGLASKSFILDGIIYFLSVYSSTNQPSYFLMDISGNLVGKLAYSNARGYLTNGLPNALLNSATVSIAYLIKDLIIPVNKTNGAAVSSAVFTQTGINMANFSFISDDLQAVDIGNNLHITGGLLWMYDGYLPVEHGFLLWPDYVEVATATTGGHLKDQLYYYSFVYEWADNQGNIHRSAPSIPVPKTTTGGNLSTNTVSVPTLRLTYKTANPVKLVGYRWSTDNQVFYQFTSVSSPTLNSKTIDSLDIVDTLADASIIGNSILYTTGGVVENIAAPATNALALYKSRLLLLDAEDPDTVWYSKQVIQTVPVELSDLFTVYVAPTVGAQGSTGKTKCLSAMDDKAIFFKKDAIYYLTGNGPDNVGTNNDFSDPIYITSTVGCDNQRSIVLTPRGLMFQSDKGIWLLARDLQTSYIGAAVEGFTKDASVVSALAIPGTNQIRFVLDSGITLMYDYFVDQWGDFEGISATAATLFQDMHIYINEAGDVFQERAGSYLDGTRPVVMSYQTSWFNLAGLQGFERAYFMYFLGVYFTPFLLNVKISYDYETGTPQSETITPDNANLDYGDDDLFGQTTPYGGNSPIFKWRLFFERQKCTSFQLTVQEIYDPTIGVDAGAGLTLSGMNLVIGGKGNYPRLPASNSVG